MLQKQQNITGINLYKGHDTVEFKNALISISERLKIPSEWILFVFYVESKLNPLAVNKFTQAYGLFQAMPSIIKSEFGITYKDYKKLSGAQQLFYFEKYIKKYIQYINSPTSLYMAIFYPKALLSYTNMTPFPKQIYSVNHIYVKNGVMNIDTIHSVISKHFSKFGIDINLKFSPLIKLIGLILVIKLLIN